MHGNGFAAKVRSTKCKSSSAFSVCQEPDLHNCLHDDDSVLVKGLIDLSEGPFVNLDVSLRGQRQVTHSALGTAISSSTRITNFTA